MLLHGSPPIVKGFAGLLTNAMCRMSGGGLVFSSHEAGCTMPYTSQSHTLCCSGTGRLKYSAVNVVKTKPGHKSLEMQALMLTLTFPDDRRPKNYQQNQGIAMQAQQANGMVQVQ